MCLRSDKPLFTKIGEGPMYAIVSRVLILAVKNGNNDQKKKNYEYVNKNKSQFKKILLLSSMILLGGYYTELFSNHSIW